MVEWSNMVHKMDGVGWQMTGRLDGWMDWSLDDWMVELFGGWLSGWLG